jgi:murein DD-endopeptidase MepM/ murein hydrolase activator NlpD
VSVFWLRRNNFQNLRILSILSHFSFKISIVRLFQCFMGRFFMKRMMLVLVFSLIVLMTALFISPALAPVQADDPAQIETGENERPFRLPFAEPSGPDTWLMAQPYGNTTGAYRQRFTTYGASGGIHFGVDLAAPCGTELVAVADGVVFAVDGPFGSPPHNLMIDHPQLGYASMYGHLLEAPDLQPGTVVEAGDVVALVGDQRSDCTRRPHLHLEFRDLQYHARKYNPITLIDANWNNLVLTGDDGRDFTHDLADPRKWQTLYDQPGATTGGPIVNDFENVWPLDWDQRDGAPQAATTIAPVAVPTPDPLQRLSIGQQITQDTCCTQPYWNQDSTAVRFIDRPSALAAAGVWGVDLEQPEAGPQLVTDRLGVYSPDGTLAAYPNRRTGIAIIERLADGETWELDTQESGISFTPNSQRVIWTESNDNVPWDRRTRTIWVADVDGRNARTIFTGQRVGPVAWLSDEVLLMSQSFPRSTTTRLFTLSLADGTQTDLMDMPRTRGTAFSPDKRYLVYYVSLEADTEENGVWLLDLQNPTQDPEKLPFFGTYRWRDNEHLVYIPFDPDATEHNFFEYNVVSGQTRNLFPGGTSLVVANNDWQVSPDGSKIALVAAKDTELDGIWVLDID